MSAPDIPPTEAELKEWPEYLTKGLKSLTQTDQLRLITEIRRLRALCREAEMSDDMPDHLRERLLAASEGR